jgi:hypothetical protein
MDEATPAHADFKGYWHWLDVSEGPGRDGGSADSTGRVKEAKKDLSKGMPSRSA